MSSRVARLVGASLGLAGLSWLGCSREAPPEGPSPPEVASLASALEGRRVFAPRLTGGLGHADCSDPDRMVCGALPGPDDPGFEPLVRALAAFERAAGAAPVRAPIGSRPHALGYLVSGLADPERLDRGVVALERAAEGGGDGSASSDLATAYLVRGELQENPIDLLRAVASAQAAVTADPALPEARFNLALALDQLGIRQRARAAWKDYLEVDGGSSWAGEARRRLRTLGATGRRDVVYDRRRDRERAMGELLPAWAAHWRAGRTSAAQEALGSAFDAGEALASVPPGRPFGGDASIRDGVRAIREASPAGRRRLARGLSAYRRGLDLSRQEDHETALRELGLAARALAGSPLASWATVERAYSLFQQGRYEESDGVLENLERRVDGARYPTLLGRSRWIRGTIAILQDRPAECFAAYHASAAAYEQAGEEASRVAVEARWVAALASQGAREEAWSRRLGVLREPAAIASAGDLRVIHTEAAQAAVESGVPEAALFFLDEALHHLRSAEEPAAEVAVLRWRAVANYRLGRRGEALEDLAKARAALSAMVDPLHRTLLAAEIQAQEGRLLADLAPDRAVASLSAAIDRFERSGLHNPLLSAYASRARARRRLGEPDRAARDLALAVDLIETRRARAGAATDRARFLTDVREVYEQAVDLAVEMGDPRRAFDLSEALHARTLGDELQDAPSGEGPAGADPVRPLSLAAVQDRLPPGVELRAFLSLPHRLLRWTVTGEGFEMASISLSATELGHQVRALRAGLRAGDRAALRAASEGLSDALLGTSVPPGGLVFVPDGPLHDLPFDLLTDPARPERWLIEAVPTAIAPSASVYARVVERDDRRGRFAPGSALVVADPAFPPELFPGLPRLAGAREEGERVGALYGQAVVLVTASATADRLLAALGRQSVVHVAAHAVPSTSDPGLSYLALADGPFYARRLTRRALGATRVVFLSACGSGREGEASGEGLGAFARALLEGGASAVVGTLWPVDDRATAELATAFHRHLVAGASTASALQLAKLERLTAGDPPAAWAAFELIGTTVTGKENKP